MASDGWTESDNPSADRWTPPHPTGPTHTPPGHPCSESSDIQLLTPAAHPFPQPPATLGKRGRKEPPSEPATHPETRR